MSLKNRRLQDPIPFPSALGDALKPLYGESAQLDPSIASLFTHLDTASITFEKGGALPKAPLRVGVCFSGGQAPGGHNVLAGLFDGLKVLHKESELIGFLNGPSGILKQESTPLTKEIIDPYRNSGGFHLIGSGRTKIESKEQLEEAKNTVSALSLDALVIIGGDDSNTNAAVLAEYFAKSGCSTVVVGVPKTIDGDLKNEDLELSFGFDTATKVYSELIGNVCIDALSAKKYTHFIRLMGRSASHIALECALQTQPNFTLIGEEIASKKLTLKAVTEQITDLIIRRHQSGRHYGVILIPEGVIEFIPEMQRLIGELGEKESIEASLQALSKEAQATLHSLPQETQKQLTSQRDEHGNVRVSQIETEKLLIQMVQEELQKRRFKGAFNPLAHFFGYEGRAAYPTLFDATYCYALGRLAAQLSSLKLSGRMCALKRLSAPLEEWELGALPLPAMMHLEKRQGKEKPVIAKALVDLQSPSFQVFEAKRTSWEIEDAYQSPGPIQFIPGEPPPLTLQLDQHSEALLR